MKNLLPTAITERPKTPAISDLVGLSGKDSSWIERLPKSRAGRIESFVNWANGAKLCTSLRVLLVDPVSAPRLFSLVESR